MNFFYKFAFELFCNLSFHHTFTLNLVHENLNSVIHPACITVPASLSLSPCAGFCPHNQVLPSVTLPSHLAMEKQKQQYTIRDKSRYLDCDQRCG